MTIYGSRVGDFENMHLSKPIQDDDAYEHTLDAQSAIRWMVPFTNLLIGTASAEFTLNGGSSDAPITPSAALVRPQSFWGSAAIQPIIIGSSILYVQNQASNVRELTYSLERDGYAGENLSVLATHIFEKKKIVKWAYQREPDSVIWCVFDDGTLACMTYLKEHQIWGWHRITTGGVAYYRDVCVVPGEREDIVYVHVARYINGATLWTVERLEPSWAANMEIENAFFVDCGLTYAGPPTSTVSGLDHLEGQTVAVLADGGVRPNAKVVNGAITISPEAQIVSVGIPYVGVLSPLPIQVSSDGDTTHGRFRDVVSLELSVSASVGGAVGWKTNDVVDIKTSPASWGDPLEPMTGWVQLTLNGSASRDLAPVVVQSKPLPMVVRAMVLEVQYA